jgi:hypothetical protein
MHLLPTSGAALCCLAFHTAALAGAWVQPEGHGMALLRFDAASARRRFDHAGGSVPMDGEFRELRWSGYWEYGLNSRWTSFGQLETASSRKTDRIRGADRNDTDMDGLLLGLRRRLPAGRALDLASCGMLIQLVSAGPAARYASMPLHAGLGCNYAYALDNISWLHGGAEMRWAGGAGAQLRLQGEALLDAGRGGQWSLGAEQRLSLHHGPKALDEDRTRLHARLYMPFSAGAGGATGWQAGIEKDVAGRKTPRATSIVAGIFIPW